MKRPGSVMVFKRHRARDLMRVYRSVLADAPVIVMPRIFAIVAESPAARFWVSEERAAAVVVSMLAGKPLPPMRPNKREMFDEIFRRFLIDRQALPHLSVFQIVSRIVVQPAPKFYLTPRTVGEYIYRIKSGQYRS